MSHDRLCRDKFVADRHLIISSSHHVCTLRGSFYTVHVVAVLLVAELHATRGHHELALGFVEKALRKDLDAFQIESRPAVIARAHTMRGAYMAALGRLDGAATSFEEVRTTYNGSAETLLSIYDMPGLNLARDCAGGEPVG